jgi:hypothetical protein
MAIVKKGYLFMELMPSNNGQKVFITDKNKN